MNDELTEQQMEIVMLLDTLYNFSKIHQLLTKFSKRALSKNQKKEIVDSGLFIETFYVDMADRVLSHKLLQETLNEKQIEDIKLSVQNLQGSKQDEQK